MEPKFNEEQFEDLKYPVLSKKLVGTRKILDVFQHLKVYQEFYDYDGSLDIEKILKYVFIMYQPTVLESLDTLEERKFQAALLAGFRFRSNKNRFEEDVEQILSCEIESVNRMIVRVCKLSRNPLFIKLKVLEQAYEDIGKLLMRTQSKSNQYKDLIANFTSLEKEISACRMELLNQETSQSIIERLYDHIDASQLGITPETISDAKVKGILEQIIKDPYA